MEICIKKVSYITRQHELHRAIANVLHKPPYSNLSPTLINFFVFLPKDRPGSPRRHKGIAILSVPTQQIGVALLQEFGTGSRRLVLHGLPLIFELSRQRIPRPGILDQITRAPYIDPSAAREAEVRADFFDSHHIPLNALQFGWDCRDSVFSVEWEDKSPSSLSFSEERREIRIAIPHGHFLNTFYIAIRFTQIDRVSVHRYQSQPIIFFSLYQPPVFEQSHAFQLAFLNRDSPSRIRLSSLPWGDHQRVVSHTSLALRLVCSSMQDLTTFRELWQAAQLRSLDESPYPVEHRSLFSEAAMEAVEQQLRTLHWCVAFQVKALLCNVSVDAYETLALIPKIREMVSSKGKRYTAAFLRSISPRLKVFSERTQSLEDCFNAAKERFMEPKAIMGGDADLFDALHVKITPTSMCFDGPYPERSNRVVRAYPRNHESFLRVIFLEEDQLHFRFNDREVNHPGFLDKRIGGFLKNGLTIAGRRFEFLAYSQSALKEHCVWCAVIFHYSKNLIKA